MRVVVLQKYFESIDDTEFSVFVHDNCGDVVVHVNFLCNNQDNYNQKIAVHASPEKFQRIIDMKKDRLVTLVLDKKVSTEDEVDRIINNAYSDLRVEKGLESGWFNGYSV